MFNNYYCLLNYHERNLDDQIDLFSLTEAYHLALDDMLLILTSVSDCKTFSFLSFWKNKEYHWYSLFATDVIALCWMTINKGILMSFIVPVIQHGHQGLYYLNPSVMVANHLYSCSLRLEYKKLYITILFYFYYFFHSTAARMRPVLQQEGKLCLIFT